MVSIITPNYNCGKFIAQTIESAINQTYRDWEMIIVDDCSSDNSLQIAQEYAQKDNRIKVFENEKNLGAALTRNRAIEISKGEYLAFLDSDDIWNVDKLEKQLKFMQENDCDFAFSEYIEIDEQNQELHRKIKVCKTLTYNKMLRHSWPGCLTVIYKQDLNNKIYIPDVKKNNDRALFLKVLKNCKKAMGQKEVLAKYRIRKGSISRNKFQMLEPYIKVVHEFEGKSKLYAYFCAFTHVLVKKLYKVEKY